MDLTEAEEIKKRCTQKDCTKKALNDPDNCNGALTQSKTPWSVKSCEPQEALLITMNKASGGNRTAAELFIILKDDTV